MDSLYKGFPVGYIIVWKNPDVRLKDGKISSGKKILIDGQQPEINKTLMKLMSIKGINLGVTELSQALTIDEVTDIFIRINSPSHFRPFLGWTYI